MKQIKACLQALFALLAFAAFAATAAQAEPELLAAKFPNPFSGTSGVSNFNTTGGNNIECKSDTFGGRWISAKLGEVVIKFKECTKGCKTEGAAAKEIVVDPSGTENLHFVLIKGTPEHTYGWVLLPPYPIIFCNTFTTSISGELVYSTTFKLNTKTLTATVSSAQSAPGVQSIKTCEEPTSECSGEKHLKMKFGSGAEEEAALVGSESVTFENEVEPVN